MKAAVVYFSLEGNTKYVAEKIASELHADIIALKPLKPYPTGKFSKYFWCGKSAVFREAPALEPDQFDPARYDLIILGTPIWAGNFTPPIRTFIKNHKLAGKNVALFACCSGGPTEKCFEELKQVLHEATVLATGRFIDPIKNLKSGVDNDLIEFCAKLKIRE